MRILVVGAGAIGGYFGGRLLQHEREVTFLVRAKRAAMLSQHGLVIRSSTGDVELPDPPTVLTADLHVPYDLILLSCKAYSLEQAMVDMAPAVGPQTAIVPLLNGIRQLDLLEEKFGAQHVLGGQCLIPVTLDERGVVHHLSPSHTLTFGERNGRASERMQKIAHALGDAGFDARPSNTIVQDMWDKWVFLTALAGITCLMRGPIGPIVAAPGGKATTLALLEECRAVAERAGHPPSQATMHLASKMLTAEASTLTASMLRDLQQGYAIEADHVVGDMLARSAQPQDAGALLSVVYSHLKVYEASRQH